jgi:hypothetical protein
MMHARAAGREEAALGYRSGVWRLACAERRTESRPPRATILAGTICGRVRDAGDPTPTADPLSTPS